MFMTKKIMIVLTTLFIACTMVACANSSNESTSISINDGNNVAITVMQSKVVEITPFSEGDNPVWSVKDSSVLKIIPIEGTAKVNILGLSKGSTELEVKVDKKTASISVVVENSAEIPQLCLPLENVDLLIGGNYNLQPSLTFMDKNLDTSFSFASSNTEVAQIDKDGKITAESLGTATIEIVADYFGVKFEKTVTVNVKPTIQVVSNLKNIEVYKQVKDSPYYYSQEFSVRVFSDGVEIDTSDISFEILDSEIATVDCDNVVYGVTAGETKLKVSFTIGQESYTDYIFVKVKEIPQVEIELSNENVYLYEYAKEQQLSAKVFVDGIEKNANSLVFTSENENVATIENGIITAKNFGKTKIRVGYDDGFKEYFSYADVEYKNSISLANSTLGESRNGVVVELKEDKAVYLDQEIDISSLTKEDSLIKLHIISQTPATSNNTDVKYIFVKLADAENPDNYITYKINTDITDKGACYIKAAATTNEHRGWRWGEATPDGNGNYFLDSDYVAPTYGELGTKYGYSMYSDESQLDKSINLAYDFATNSTYAIDANGNSLLILDLDTIVEAISSAYVTNWSTFEGFASGKVKMSIYATGYSDDIDVCKIYIEQVNNVNAQEYGLDKFIVK